MLKATKKIKIVKKNNMGIERITKRIVLDNQFLDKDLNRHLLNKLKDIAENDCSKEYGYIIEVKKILEILDNYISNVNSELIFIVLFEAETIKPEINSIYEDEVYLALRGGIFFEVSKKFKVLIPPVSLRDYVFNSDTKEYIKGVQKLGKGSRCRLKITGVRYMNKNFDCFGELVEVLDGLVG